ncbi:unnamed protein product [Zymoseptoria tritici ST99CH_3D1]|uniref:Cyclin N-terminal domain-containing protein n=1 Tax=Zymoseptoria tritici ST99CH_1E4 TaxID=1276532 RepID=A0A2H1FWL6_ZYMTR|nr:unnamed protein product [Zymoseptoria tritici ST99CH_1E4]SMR46958.1 unnamed protein product [Zymoseptoria tritici ST99CH_3D1]
MAPITEPSHLLNPLVTSLQLETSSSQLDGIPKDIEDSTRFATASLIQAAGILLHLPQEIIAQAIVVLSRFWVGPDGGSILDHDAEEVAAAALYLVAKPSAFPITPRQTLTTIKYLSSLPAAGLTSLDMSTKLGFSDWHVPESQYEAARNRLFEIEGHILRVLGFQTHVALPHTLCINYLQTIDAFQSSTGSRVAKAAFAHLNSALLSPQLLYLTHQPSALAVAAIYLASREIDVKLPEVEWWEVFDVDREELGFLVVAFRSIAGFALEEQRKWSERKAPMTVVELQAEVERYRTRGLGD